MSEVATEIQVTRVAALHDEDGERTMPAGSIPDSSSHFVVAHS